MNNAIFRAAALTRSHSRALKRCFRVIGVREARAAGATHEGTFYGLPIWARDPHGYDPMVFAKWNAADWLIPVLAMLGAFFAWMAGDDEEGFPLVVRRIRK